MGKKFIPNWKRASSRTTTQFSRRSKGSCDRGRAGCGAFRPLGRIQGKTSNLRHPTSNTQRNGILRRRCGLPAIGFRASDVRCKTFCPCPARRVMGAWWPSRSSKPLSARSTGRGMFDSYPLRHSKCAMRNSNPRRGLLWTVVLPFRTPRSAFLAEGRWWSCHANRSLS